MSEFCFADGLSHQIIPISNIRILSFFCHLQNYHLKEFILPIIDLLEFGVIRGRQLISLLKPVIQYESYFKMHYTFLVQLLQEYPITDSQFQKLLFQSSDSSSLWIRVLRAADQSLTNISFCVGWSRLITHARIILLKKRKSKEIRTEGWNYISACLKKCAIKKDAMIKKMQLRFWTW